jgi:putative heme-binding domain-containing protein
LIKRIVLASLPLAGGALIAFRTAPVQQGTKITVPQGFAVEEVLSPALAQSVVALTFDSKGQLVLGKEFGNPVTLIPNGSGGYEQRIFTDQVHTTQGMTFDGPDLIFDGAGPQGVGLYRVVDDNGDSRADRVELIEQATAAIQDHGPHAPLFGPDGYLYWVMGNFSYIYKDRSPLSPVRGWEEATLLEARDPRGFGDQYNGNPAGMVIRKAIASRGAGNTPELGVNTPADWELFAHGFRNEYDAAFNSQGELFTFDSDMEWDRDLPWYRGTSTAHVVPGGDYGYREGSDKHPRYYFDDAPIMEDQGRGSPTGVTVLQSYNYPREYWDMVLQADWSRGRVIGTAAARSGASYAGKSMNFMYGEPLNVTDLEVGPDGNLYFSLGGRSTAGGIYRVVYRGSDAMQKPAATTPLDRVLTAMQPLAPYSRELARATKEQLGERGWQQQLIAVIRNTQAPAERRARALELLQVFGPFPDEALLASLRGDPAWEVRAASTYSLGLKPTDSARRELVARLKDPDPFVQRRAAEALLRTGVNPTMLNAPINPVQDVFPLLANPDRSLRYAARTLLRELNTNQWKEAAFAASTYPQAEEALMAYIQTMKAPDIWSATRLARRDLELLQPNPSGRELLDLIRVIQRTIMVSNGVTNIPAGASTTGVMQTRQAEGINGGAPPRPANAPPPGPPQGGQGQIQPVFTQIGTTLLQRFPFPDSLVNREAARVFAALKTPGAVPKLAAELNRPGNSREQQLHMAYMLSFIDTGWDDASVNQMIAFFERVYREGWKGGAGFAPELTLIRDRFLSNLPPDKSNWYTMAMQRIQAAQPQLATGNAGGFNAQPISEQETLEELVYNPNVLAANPALGPSAFQKGQCVSCHTFGPIGMEFGPDLTTVGQRFSRKDLVTAIMHPSEVVSDLYSAEVITRKNGTKVLGMARDAGDAVVVQVSGGNSVTIPLSDIASRVKTTQSPMPEGLLNLLSSQERLALIAMLQAGPASMPDTAVRRINGR